MADQQQKNDGFVVSAVHDLIFPLTRLTPLELIYRRDPERRLSFAVVERFVLWNLGGTVLAVVLSFIAGPSARLWFLPVFLYGGSRCVNILAVQADILLWFELPLKKRRAAIAMLGRGIPRRKLPGANAPIAGPMRSIILLLINYVEIVLWFSILYFNIGLQVNGELVSAREVLGLSFHLMSSFGLQPQLAPQPPFVWFALTLQAGIGLLMTLAVLGRFLAAVRLRFMRVPL